MDQTTPPPFNPRVHDDFQLRGAALEAEMSQRAQRLEDYRRRIGSALTAFEDKCPAAVRVGLDEFLPCVTFSKTGRLAPVPRRANRHANNSGRGASSFKAELAEFHVADVIQVYHAALNHVAHPLIWPMAITGLGWRVRALEGYARTGLEGCRVDGSASSGYRLVDHPSGVVERDHAPIFGNSTISKEPKDTERGEQPQ